MIFQLVVPGPIEDVEEVRVLEWDVAEGKAVAAGALLVELETHKAVVEVLSSRQATLRRILCQPGEWQKIGKSLALLSDTADEPMPDHAGEGLQTLPVEF